MAKNKNNEELRQQAFRALAEGRAEISAEMQRLRERMSPSRVLHRVVDRHTGLVVFVAVVAGMVPTLLAFRNKPPRAHLPLMISTAKQPPKPVLGAVLLATLGLLARTVAPALIKSAVIPHALKFLTKQQPYMATPSKK